MKVSTSNSSITNIINELSSTFDAISSIMEPIIPNEELDNIIKKNNEEIARKNAEESEIRRLTIERFRKEEHRNKLEVNKVISIKKVLEKFKFTKKQGLLLQALSKAELNDLELKQRTKSKNIQSLARDTRKRIKNYNLQNILVISSQKRKKIIYFNLIINNL